MYLYILYTYQFLRITTAIPRGNMIEERFF